MRSRSQPLIHEVRVPASTSNLGAGFDCFGMALDIWLRARLIPGRGAPRYTGHTLGLDPDQDIIWSELRSHKAAAHYRLEVHSDVPVGRGLGSSAAATLAMLALTGVLEQIEQDTDDLFHQAAQREGHPDNAAPSAFGGAVLAINDPESDATHVARVNPHHTIGVALAVPEQTVETRVARSVLPNHVSSRDLVTQASHAAALILGLERGDPVLIGMGMEDCYATPRRAGLIVGYEQARTAASAAGAFGMAISGSGSALIALTTTERARSVASAMAEALTGAGSRAVPLTPAISQSGLQVSSSKAP